jgi:hypothetical protein
MQYMNLRRFSGAFVMYAIAIGVIEALFLFLGVVGDAAIPGFLSQAYVSQGLLRTVVLGVIVVRGFAVIAGFYISLVVYGLPFLQIAEVDLKKFIEGVVVLSAANVLVFLPIANSLLAEAAFNLAVNLALFYFALDIYGAIEEDGPSVPFKLKSKRAKDSKSGPKKKSWLGGLGVFHG